MGKRSLFQPLHYIAAEAKLVYSAYMGTEDQGLPVNVYTMRAAGYNISISVSPMKDKKFCAPLGETLFGHVGSSKYCIQ